MSDEHIGSDSRVRVAPNVHTRPLGAEIVLLDFAGGEYYALDAIGTQIWRALEAGQSLGAIADTLVERYELARDDALTDVRELVGELRRRALVTLTP